MALAQVSACLSPSVRDACLVSSPRTQFISRVPLPSMTRARSVFATGSPLLIHKSSRPRNSAYRAPISIRCEQSTQESNSVDVWLGRLAMVGFAVAISVEIATGKGLLEVTTRNATIMYMLIYVTFVLITSSFVSFEQNFGLTTPLPTVALAVTALVGVLTAVFIFQSASNK